MGLCVIVCDCMVYPDPKFLIFSETTQSETIYKIKHNGSKWIILISVLYQNAFTSRILEPSSQAWFLVVDKYKSEKSILRRLPVLKLNSYVVLSGLFAKLFPYILPKFWLGSLIALIQGSKPFCTNFFVVCQFVLIEELH